MDSEWITFTNDFAKTRTSVKLEIKKFNKENNLCYYDSVDLTCKNFTDEQVEIVSKLFTSAGFKVDVFKYTYFGIYDPSRNVNLIEIHPTDEQLLEREIRLNEDYFPKRKKLFGII